MRFVSVYDKVTNGLDNWDTHVNNFGRLKDQLLPPCDMAFSALVEDLQDRGLLDSTLVIMLGEFGRTPQDQRPGRPRPLARLLQRGDGRRRRHGRRCIWHERQAGGLSRT